VNEWFKENKNNEYTIKEMKVEPIIKTEESDPSEMPGFP